MPAENTHHFAKKMEEPVSKTDVGKVGGDTLNKNAIRFTNLDEANEWGNLYYNDWITSLSESEKEAIKRYTGNDYRKINNYLRGVSDSLEGLDIQVIDNITSGLDKAYVPRNLKVYRGTDLKPFIDLYKLNDEGEVIVDSLIGKTIKDDGFTSTAMVRESSFGHMNVSWEINVPEGSNAAYIGGISHYPNEAELLLNAGQEMVIKQATVNSDGKIHLVLDLLK
ncbi:ADP-ribosyltransferase [Virgibacillus massiliensis]|nr:ADP-ribosyltransferase [Virgibacillus massiliensis]